MVEESQWIYQLKTSKLSKKLVNKNYKIRDVNRKNLLANIYEKKSKNR